MGAILLRSRPRCGAWSGGRSVSQFRNELPAHRVAGRQDWPLIRESRLPWQAGELEQIRPFVLIPRLLLVTYLSRLFAAKPRQDVRNSGYALLRVPSTCRSRVQRRRMYSAALEAIYPAAARILHHLACGIRWRNASSIPLGGSPLRLPDYASG